MQNNIDELEKRKQLLITEAEPLAVKIEASMRILGEYHHRRIGLIRSKLGNWMENKDLLVWAMPAGWGDSLYKVWYKDELVFSFLFDHNHNSATIRIYRRDIAWLELAEEFVEKASAVKKVKNISDALERQEAKERELRDKWGLYPDGN